jgi:hypothetical protein
MRRLKEEMEKLQHGKEKENAVNADLESKDERISEVKNLGLRAQPH